MSRSVAIVRTGTANVRSVVEALLRAGFEPTFASPEDVSSAERVVLPGVGSFGAAMANLGGLSLSEPLRDRIRAGKPTLCICLGMQLLGSGSEESPGVRGLGVIDTVVRRLSGEVRVPQMGWNRVDAPPEARLVQSGHAYFANSFGLFEPPSGWASATVDYGGTFVAAIERGAVLACQFHPELSGDWGQTLIERWLRC